MRHVDNSIPSEKNYHEKDHTRGFNYLTFPLGIYQPKPITLIQDHLNKQVYYLHERVNPHLF